MSEDSNIPEHMLQYIGKTFKFTYLGHVMGYCPRFDNYGAKFALSVADLEWYSEDALPWTGGNGPIWSPDSAGVLELPIPAELLNNEELFLNTDNNGSTLTIEFRETEMRAVLE